MDKRTRLILQYRQVPLSQPDREIERDCEARPAGLSSSLWLLSFVARSFMDPRQTSTYQETRPSSPIPIPKRRVVVQELPEAFVPPHLLCCGRFGELETSRRIRY